MLLLRNGVRALREYETQALRLQRQSLLPSSRPTLRASLSANQTRRPISSVARSSQGHRSEQHWMLPSALFAAATVALLLSQKQVLELEAPQNIEKEVENVRIDPSTSQSFPVTLPTPVTRLPSSCGKLHLVGLGVRTVSFLRVKVYVAGLYMDSNALSKLDSIDGWKGFEAAWMLDSKEEHSGEKLIAALLDHGITFAIRIVPVRSTDFGHLRDGFTVSQISERAIQGRAKLARKQSLLNESTDEALSQSLQALKEAFPRSSLPKGQPLDLFFTPSTSGNGLDLTMEEDGKVLGKVESPRGHAESQFSVARQLMLAYLADKDEISKPFKESVVLGLEQAIRQGV